MNNDMTFDLRLLLVFDAVMRERNVTRAAEALHLAQPTVSNAISRLRNVMNDEVFVRCAGGVRPTPRALELANPIAQALRQIQDSLQPTAFVPNDADMTFNLAMSDQVGAVLLPIIASYLQEVAPGIRLKVHPKVDAEIPRQLAFQTIDFAIGVFNTEDRSLCTEPLYSDEYVCVMRKDHPLARGPLSAKQFVAASHLLVRPAGAATGLIDDVFKKKGLSRKISVTTSQVISVPSIIQRSDLVATLLSKTANSLHNADQFHVVRLPFRLGPVQISIFWHASVSYHRPHAWLRGKLAELCQAI